MKDLTHWVDAGARCHPFSPGEERREGRGRRDEGSDDVFLIELVCCVISGMVGNYPTTP
jgi:hypothetical protein